MEAALGVLPPGREIHLPVLSGSMGPGIPVGGTLVVHGCDWKRATAGDVVVFRDGKKLVAHRQLFRLSLCGHALVYQKGDVNPLGGFVPGRRIVGIVTEARDAGGSLLYSHDSDRTRARAEAGKQAVAILCSPFKRVARLFRRVGSRWSRHA